MLLFIAFILLSVSTTAAATASPATGVEDAIRTRLAESGFERVTVLAEGGEIIVTYENRLYAYEVRAVKEVLALLAPFLDTDTDITLIPQHTGIPMLSISIPSGSYVDFVRGRIPKEAFASTISISTDPSRFTERLEGKETQNGTVGKVDVVVHPQITAQLGAFSDPVRSQVNVAPEIRTSLWKGMSLSAQAVLPLQSDFGEDEGLRPGVVSISQTVRLPRTTTVTASAGLFSLDRYGIDLTAGKLLAGGRWRIGANLGFTGFATYDDRELFYDDLERWTPSASIGYRLPRYNMTIDATAGRFVLADSGFRLDVSRRFGPVSIGFFGMTADGEKNAGFGITIPLFPTRHMTPGPVRVRVADSFNWQYEYRGLDSSVRQYRTTGSQDTFWKGLDPAFLRNLIADLKNWS